MAHCRHLSSLTSKLLHTGLPCPRLYCCQLPQTTLLQSLGAVYRPTISLRSISIARASFTDQNLAADANVGEIDWSPDRINAVSLIGSLGRDLELRYLANGSVVGNVALAVRRNQDKTDWFELEVWGALAERAKDVVRKGSKVHVEGRLKVDEWTDAASNSKRSRTKVCGSGVGLGSTGTTHRWQHTDGGGGARRDHCLKTMQFSILLQIARASCTGGRSHTQPHPRHPNGGGAP